MQLPPSKTLTPPDRRDIRMTPSPRGAHYCTGVPVLLSRNHLKAPSYRDDISDLHRTTDIKLIALLVTTQIIHHIIPMRIGYPGIRHRPARNRAPLCRGE